jgi:hypothetical protein
MSLGLPDFADEPYRIGGFVAAAARLPRNLLIELLILPDFEALAHEIGEHLIWIAAVTARRVFKLLGDRFSFAQFHFCHRSDFQSAYFIHYKGNRNQRVSSGSLIGELRA